MIRLRRAPHARTRAWLLALGLAAGSPCLALAQNAGSSPLDARCERGDPNACVGAADAHYAQRRLDRAAPMFRRACDANVALGCFGLAAVLDESPTTAATSRPWFERACRLGLAMACERVQPGAGSNAPPSDAGNVPMQLLGALVHPDDRRPEVARIPIGPAAVSANHPPSTSAEPALAREQIRDVVVQHLADVRRCHETVLRRRPRAAGTVVVRFSVAADGRVRDAVAARTSYPDPALVPCLLRVAAAWRFAAPRGGATVSVNYPFVFEAQ